MKKITHLLVVLLIFTFGSTSAQVHFGIKAGVSFSDAQTDVMIDAFNEAPGNFTSFVVGGVAEIPIHNNISFQPELLYMQKGFTIDEGTSFDIFGMNVPIGARATTAINYLEVPLLAKVKLGAGNAKVYGIAGPSIGYATSASIQSQATLLISFNLPEVDLDLSDNMYNRTDISGILGAGAEYSTLTGKLFTDIRYQHSFSNIIDSPIENISVSNRGFQWTVGYSHLF